MEGPKPLDAETLQSIVRAQINAAVGSRIGDDGAGDFTADREEAMKYYFGEPLGNEVDGRSQIVSRDVHDTIEWMLPSIIEVFTSSDDAVRYEPYGPEDEAYAEQATDYANYVFHKENDGFQILYDMVKDALMLRQGIAKVWWDEREEQKREDYTGLTDVELAKLEQDDELDIEEIVEIPDMQIDPMSGMELPMELYDVRAVRTTVEGRVRVESVPPEEFLFSRRAVRLDDERGNMLIPFVCHRVKKTISDLVAEGFAWDDVKDIPSSYEGEYNEERTTRHGDDDIVENSARDPSMREVWIHECYLRVDYDGDGIAEVRKVTVGGTGHRILENVEVAEQPFVTITPVPTPHALVGQSVTDQVKDVQKLKTTIWRQLLDNIYNVNNSRAAVNERVDLDTLLSNAIGGAIRIEGRDSVGDAIQFQQTPSIAGHIFPMLEYADQVKESRAGVSRLNQGLDPDALSDTAAGMNMLMTASQRRQLLIARIFANTGIRDLFKKILRLTVAHQEREKIIRLRGQFVTIEPSRWNPHMDVTVSVGLGYGSKEQQLVARRQILDIQGQIVQMQGGFGPLVNEAHASHALLKFVEATGEQQPEAYFGEISTDEASQPKPPPPPDPEQVKAQMEGQKMQMQAQMDQQKAQSDIQMKQADMQMKAQSDQRKAEMELQKLQAQLLLEREKHQAQMQMEREKHALDMELKRQEAEFNARLRASEAQQKAALAQRSVGPRVVLERNDIGDIVGGAAKDDD